jgi:hypothetical protein
MRSFVLQEWTTIRGGVTTVTQAEPNWLDLSDYQDVAFWIEIGESTNTPTLFLQTSPTYDESLFTSVVPSQAMSAGLPVVLSAFMTVAPVPLARFVRWQITGTAPWDATFRIVATANASGV